MLKEIEKQIELAWVDLSRQLENSISYVTNW